MSAPNRKTYRLTYCVEQGFTAEIDAASPAQAKKLFNEKYEDGDITNARCVHRALFIIDVAKVKP